MNWLKGLLAAAISGATSTLGAMVLDPDHFNTANLKHLGIIAGIGAVTGTVGYLKQSPLPNGTVADPTQAIDPKRFAGTMVLVLALTLPLIACTPPTRAQVITWLTNFQQGLTVACDINAGGYLNAADCHAGDTAFTTAIDAAKQAPAETIVADVKHTLAASADALPVGSQLKPWLTAAGKL